MHGLSPGRRIDFSNINHLDDNVLRQVAREVTRALQGNAAIAQCHQRAAGRAGGFGRHLDLAAPLLGPGANLVE